MQKFICAIMCVALLASLLAGCGSAKQDSTVSAYLDMAQDYLDEGDYASALDVLQKGLEKTNDTKLAMKIAEVAALQQSKEPTDATTVPAAFDCSQFAGKWAEADASWEKGGMILEILPTDAGMSIKITYTQAAPMSRTAEVVASVSATDIHDGAVSFRFDDDGWGNAGNVTLKLADPMICTVADLVASPVAQWGMYAGDFELQRNDAADEQMTLKNILSSENQRRINIFLSNFAEQNFNAYPANDYALLKFAYRYSKINSPTLVEYKNESAYMDKNAVDDILMRFFDRTVTPSDNSMVFSNPENMNEHIFYGAGVYEFTASFGEFCGYVAIADTMVDNGDGTYDVQFSIYSSQADSLNGYYDLTADQAVSDGSLQFCKTGNATVKDYTRPNGVQAYQLLWYSVN